MTLHDGYVLYVEGLNNFFKTPRVTLQSVCSKDFIPLPATFGFGSIEPITTLGIMYCFIMSTQGGVF